MTVAVSGAQWRAFLHDEEFWPKEAYYDDCLLSLNGVVMEDGVAISEVKDNDRIEIEGGMVFTDLPGSNQDWIDLEDYLNRWLSKREASDFFVGQQVFVITPYDALPDGGELPVYEGRISSVIRSIVDSEIPSECQEIVRYRVNLEDSRPVVMGEQLFRERAAAVEALKLRLQGEVQSILEEAKKREKLIVLAISEAEGQPS